VAAVKVIVARAAGRLTEEPQLRRRVELDLDPGHPRRPDQRRRRHRVAEVAVVARHLLALDRVERAAVVAGDRQLAVIDRDPVGVARQIHAELQLVVTALLEVERVVPGDLLGHRAVDHRAHLAGAAVVLHLDDVHPPRPSRRRSRATSHRSDRRPPAAPR
jgi:hypothetical protein